jgi:hypothetical protein
MSPIVPARFRSPLTTPRFPAPTASEYSPRHDGLYDYLTLTNGAAEPTPAALLDRYAAPQQYYVTLTITLPSDVVYTTTILLGDDFPTALPTDPIQQSTSQPTLTPAAVQKTDSNNPGNVAGIIIGVLGGLAVLAGVFYVYTLRARQYLASNKSVSGSRRKRKKKKRKKSKKTTWFTFKFKWKKDKKRRRSRRSSMSTAGKSWPGVNYA